MFAFVAVRFGVVMYVEVRFAADSLETADKFVNTPFVAFMLLLASSPATCILSNWPFSADILLNFFQSNMFDIASAKRYPLISVMTPDS